MPAPSAAEGGGTADAGDAYGLMRLGGALLALPVAQLREVIEAPTHYAPLPLPLPGLLGAVNVRGSIVPVLDLAEQFGRHAESGRGVVVLMREQGRLLGLRMDAVIGMVRLPPTALQPLGLTGLARHSFEVEAGVATLLDAAALCAQPGLPTALEPLAAPGKGRDAAAGGPREAQLLFSVGGMPLAIPADMVEATVPLLPIADSPLRGGFCLGVIEHHGLEVPVVDTLQLLSLGPPCAAAESPLVVLRFGAEARLALTLDQVLDIQRVRADEVMPLQRLGLAQVALFRGMLPGERQHLLLDAKALAAHPLLASLASLSKPVAGAVQQREVGEAGSGRAYLTYRVDTEMASPLTQVTEILPLPADRVVLPERGDAVLGLFTHRGAALPLLCLARLLGCRAAAPGEQSRVLLVESAGCRVGLVVSALCSIEAGRWEQAGEAAGRSRLQLVEVGVGEQRRTLGLLDLARLVAGLADAVPDAGRT